MMAQEEIAQGITKVSGNYPVVNMNIFYDSPCDRSPNDSNMPGKHGCILYYFIKK